MDLKVVLRRRLDEAAIASQRTAARGDVALEARVEIRPEDDAPAVANGRVVIMNPAGIFFGPSAMVDVNALVATTARTSQADFLAGTLNFSL
ncbi:MAG: hypothetical protein O9277_16325, partial [Magnetospirillum sp.]|nr:hypothetical protein [Magnetospirillum sp.]